MSIGAFTLTVIPLVFHFFLGSTEDRRQQLPFHSFAWKQRSYDSDANFMWPTRKRMADDLLKRGLLKQKTRAEVIELLGEPDNASFTSKDGIAYVLGPERGYGVDYEWLQIHFDTRGYVRDANTTTD